MADKQEKKPDAAAGAAGAEKKDKEHGKAAGGAGSLLTKTPVLIGVVMIIEAVIIFAGVKFLGGGAPQGAVGAELTEPAANGEAGAHGEGAGKGEAGAIGEGVVDKKKPVEILVLEFRAPNKLSGRTFIYDVSIFAVTRGEHAEVVRAAVKDREASIKDRIRTIIAQSDPDKLGGGTEPGLETLRRQVKHQLDELLGEKLIDEVLVPRCIPFRADF